MAWKKALGAGEEGRSREKRRRRRKGGKPPLRNKIKHLPVSGAYLFLKTSFSAKLETGKQTKISLCRSFEGPRNDAPFSGLSCGGRFAHCNSPHLVDPQSLNLAPLPAFFFWQVPIFEEGGWMSTQRIDSSVPSKLVVGFFCNC